MAIRAVGYLAGQEDLLLRFAALTGMTIDDVRARVAEPEVLGGVIDFILGDERLLLAFAETIDVPPETVYIARRKLPGASTEG